MTTESGCILYFLTETTITPESACLVLVLKTMEPASYRVLLSSTEGELAQLLTENSITFDTIVTPELKRIGGKVKPLAAARFALGILRYYRKLFRYFRMFPFELVHAFGFKANLFSVGLKVIFNAVLVWQFSEVLGVGLRLKVFRGFAGVFSDHIVAISQIVARQLGRSLHWRDKVTVQYRGYAPGFSGDALTLASDGALRVGFVFGGEAWLENNEKVFLRALELLNRESRVEGVILLPLSLEHSLKEQLLKRIDEFHLSDLVKLEEIEKFHRDGEIARAFKKQGVQALVHSSLGFEPFARDVIECMASGIVVVGCRSGVLPELLLHEDTGILVNAGDSNAIAQEILKLHANAKLCQSLTETARSEFTARFSFEKYLSSLYKVYGRYWAKFSEQEAKTESAEDKESIDKKAA